MNKKELLYASMLVVVSTLASILIWGFHFGIKNNEFHAIIVDKIAYGTSFQGDALASAMHNFVSPFWIGVGFLVKVFPEKTVYFLFFFISRALLCIGIAVTISAFSRSANSLPAYFLASLVTISSGLVNVLPLGDNAVISDYLSHTFVSAGLCLVSFGLSVKKKYIWSAILLGITYNINAMQVNFTLGMLLVIWFVNARDEMNAYYKSFGLPIALFLLCASPTIYWIASVLHESPARDYMSGSALADFAKYYLPGHYFWAIKSFREKLNGISIITIPLTLALSAHVVKGGLFDHRMKREVLIASSVSLLYLIVGAISAGIFPSRLFFQLHLFRSDIIIYIITLSLLLSLLFNKNLQNYTRLMMIAAIAECLTNAFFKAQLFVLWAVIIEGARYYKVKEFLIKVINVSFFLAVCVLFIRTGYREMILLIPFLLYGLSSLMHQQGPSDAPVESHRNEQTMAAHPNKRHGLARGNPLVIGYLCAFIFVLYSSYAVLTTYYSETEADVEEIKALAVMVSDKVPENSLFLIPPWYQIRPYLKHGVFVSMKDGAAYLWDKGYEYEYIRRLKVLGIEYTPGVKFNESEIKEYFYNHINGALGNVKHEGVTHVILPKKLFSYAGPMIGISENFIALDLDSALKFCKKSPSPTQTSATHDQQKARMNLLSISRKENNDT